MKKLLFCISMLLCLSNVISAKCNSTVPLKHRPNGSTHTGSTKAPALPWYIDVTNNVITMPATVVNYTLNLYDEDGDVAYSVFVPVGTTQVVLPSSLSGSFELRFETDTYYYYGEITL